eukprot:jgi/Botrbrau1/2287/Bobra.101_2s0110.1
MVAFTTAKAGCIRPCKTPVGGVKHLSSVSFHSGGGTLALLPRLRLREARAYSFAITCQDGSTKKQFENWTTDAYKEESRRFRRTVFMFDEWAKHRSTARYWRHIAALFQSRIVWGLAEPLAAVLGLATFICVYEQAREVGIVPVDIPSILIIPSAPFNLTSFALSLLLVFRTNTSYSRWNEARKIWGGMLNRTRDISRQCLTWFEPDEVALRAMLVRWVIAYPKAVMCHIRVDNDLATELKDTLLPEEIALVCSADHRPNFVLNVISELIKSSRIPATEVYRMDENLTYFADVVGACERILKTPIPLSYTRHTSRFLVIWLAILPFTLYPSCKWATIPSAGLIAFLLLGIEEIGVQIEEPFSILPLEAICATSERNLKEMAAEADGIREFVSASVLSDKLIMAQAASNGNGKNGNGNGNGNGKSKKWDPNDTEFLAIAGRAGRNNGANAYVGISPNVLDAGITE